jgi:outer membrane protein assembly factor BamB
MRGTRYVVLAAVLALFAPVAAAAQPGGEVPGNVRFGAERTGSWSGPLDMPVRAAWSVDVDSELGAPIVADGRVFALAHDDDAGSRLIAFDAVTGSQLWAPVDLGGGAPSTLAADGGLVFVPTSWGVLLAFDAATGDEVWRFRPDHPDRRSHDGLLAADGSVFVTASGDGGPAVLYALDQATGAVEWQREAAGTATLAGDRLLVSGGCGGIGAFDRTSGDLLWSWSAGCSGPWGPPSAVRDGLVTVSYWAHGGRLLDLETGEEVRSFPSDGAAVVLGDEHVYTVVDDQLEARPLTGGAATWRAETAPLVGDPVQVGDHLFVATADGILAIDATDGEVAGIREQPTSPGVTEPRYPPAFGAADDLLVVAARGVLTALVSDGTPTSPPPTPLSPPPAPEVPRSPSATSATTFRIDAARTGRSLGEGLAAPLRESWRARLPGEVSYPVIVGDGVYVTVEAGAAYSVHAFDRRTGDQRWEADLGRPSRGFAGATHHGDTLIVLDGDGNLRGFDEVTGQERWHLDVPVAAGTTARTWGFQGAPTVHEDTVYVDGGGRGGNLIAIDPVAVEVRWVAPTFTGTPLGYAVHGPSLFHEEGCRLTAIDLAARAERWTEGRQACSATYPAPAVHGRTLFTAPTGMRTNGRWDAHEGTLLGSHADASHGAYDGDLAIHLVEGRLQAVDLTTNRVLWRFAPGERIVAAPVVAGGTVYAASEPGTVYAVDARTGEAVWDADLGAPVRRSGPHGNSHARSTTGIGIGEDTLVVPASDVLVAYESVTAPRVPALGAIQARLLDAACPPGATGRAGFTDVAAGDVHRPGIDCVASWGVTSGRTATTYGPAAAVTRAQMATFLANLLEASGRALPDPGSTRFVDTAGSPHTRSIERLAAAGITTGRTEERYDPNAPVTRAQMATFLVRAHAQRTDRQLLAADAGFADVGASVHTDAIGRAARAGIAAGTGGGAYAPERPVTRAQMATFLARTLALLVEEGHVAPR